MGPKHVIPTYWVGTDLTTVDWATVPLPAVVKPTHASGAGYFLNSQEDIEVLMKRRPEKGMAGTGPLQIQPGMGLQRCATADHH
ncbi:ATP-grasp fold amidoligase family protein [Roseibium salinum]|nr:ATP-grasp fold amidoligase family protein [Roseibium salinum]